MRYFMHVKGKQFAVIAEDGREMTGDTSKDGKAQLATFMDAKHHGKPECWTYDPDTAGDLVKCHDLKKWAADLGNPTLPALPTDEGNVKWGAQWVRDVWGHLHHYAGADAAMPAAQEDEAATQAKKKKE